MGRIAIRIVKFGKVLSDNLICNYLNFIIGSLSSKDKLIRVTASWLMRLKSNMKKLKRNHNSLWIKIIKSLWVVNVLYIILAKVDKGLQA